MKRALRLLALAGTLGAASASLSACDASPYAASVNGHVISQLTLNQQLKEFAAAPAFVSSFDSSESAQNGGTGATVTGSGGPGTYAQSFVARVLTGLITGEALQQHLSAAGKLPSPQTVETVRAVLELDSTYWDQLPQSLRQVEVQEAADEAALTPVTLDQSTLQSDFSQVAPYVFSQVCLQQASAFDSNTAMQIIASGTVAGTRVCYDQASLEDQPAAFQSAVHGLSVGQIAQTPVKTSYGYLVVKLVSRDTPRITEGVAQAITLLTSPNTPQQVQAVLDAERIKVNPAYGTWTNGQVRPPTPPGS